MTENPKYSNKMNVNISSIGMSNINFKLIIRNIENYFNIIKLK